MGSRRDDRETDEGESDTRFFGLEPPMRKVSEAEVQGDADAGLSHVRSGPEATPPDTHYFRMPLGSHCKKERMRTAYVSGKSASQN